MKDQKKILFVGETWFSHFSNIKGRNEYSGAEYFENPGLTKMRELFNKNGFNFTHIPNHKASTDFPFKLDELRKYDCIIFSDVGSDTFLLHPKTVNLANPQRVPNRISLVDEYVGTGGGFLMIGGWMSFSGIECKARYHMTELERTLPIQMLPFDDRIERCEGIKPKAIDLSHPILENIKDEWPYFLGYQKLIPKPNSKVLLSFEQDPLLVVSEYKNGRVAAFSSDCGPHWGMMDFLNWPSYEVFWVQLVNWLINI